MRIGSLFLTGLVLTTATLLLSHCGKAASTFVVVGSGKAATRNGNARAAGSPTSANLTVYAVYISPNTDCTSAILAGGDGTTAVTKDMVARPTLFSGSPTPGTYKCLILKMKDTITFRPDATAAAAFPAACSTSADSTFDIYRAGEVPQWKDKDGASIVPTGTVTAPGADTVFIFASTVAADARTGSIGASTNQVLSLTGAFTIPATGTFTATFTTDFNNKVNINGANCWMDPSPFTITGM